MRIDDAGGQTYGSIMGAICSIILLLITAFYAYLKLMVLIEKTDVNILSSELDMYFSDTDEFTYANGLNIAVAFTAYDQETEWILTPEYGELVFNHASWGSELGFVREQIDAHNCTAEELSITEDKQQAKFYPIHESNQKLMKQYSKKFICIREEDLRIRGAFDSDSARQLNI